MLLGLLFWITVAFGAEVSIISDGEPLTIFLDGARLGNTPLVVEVATGKHVLAAQEANPQTKAVRRGASDDELLDALFAGADETRVEATLNIPGPGSAEVTFSWLLGSADVQWTAAIVEEPEIEEPTIDPAAQAARERADAYREKKRYSDAIASYYEAIRLGAPEEELARWISLCKEELGQEELAAAKKLGASLCASGNIDGAVAAYEQAITLGGNANEINGLIDACRSQHEQQNVLHAALGRADDFVNQGQISEAIAAYREAISLGGSATELEQKIRELELWQANLVVKVSGLDKRGTLMAYLQGDEGRIEPSSIERGLVRFTGIAAETDYLLFVGGEGYKGVQQKVEALTGRSTREISVAITYQGGMKIDVSEWSGQATVQLEQPPQSMELSPGVHTVTATPAEVIVTSAYGSLRWPLKGEQGFIHLLDIPSMLPSSVTLTGVPSGSAVEVVASPDDIANGPVSVSSTGKMRKDDAVEVVADIRMTDLLEGSYEIRVEHPILGSDLRNFDLAPGSLQKVAVDWREMPEGVRVEQAYTSWRERRTGVPKEFWLGSLMSVASAGALAMMVDNMNAVKVNHADVQSFQATYEQQMTDWQTEEAMSTFDSMENARDRRNQGLAFAGVEGLLGTGGVILSGMLLRKAFKKLGGSRTEWSLETALNSTAAVEKTETQEGSP